jgi:hypothetical protein
MWVPVATAWRFLESRLKETASRCGGKLQVYRISSRGQPTRGGPPARELIEGLTIPHRKTPACYEIFHRASELAGSCEHGNEPLGSIKGGEFLE